MNVDDYQQEAMSLLNPALNPQDVLENALMGLCGESGEAIDLLKKHRFQGHPLDKEKLKKELGDVAWYAQESAERAEAQLADAPDDLARLNLLLSACLPMRDEDAAFTAMLLPMATSPEGRAMALTYLDALSDRFHPLLEPTIAQGVQSGTLFTEIRGVAGIVLHLLGDCFFDLAGQLMQAKNDKQPCDLPALVDLLTRYRRAVEVLLNAPFGSVTLLTLEDVESMAQRLLQ